VAKIEITKIETILNNFCTDVPFLLNGHGLEVFLRWHYPNQV
jgi:hypothetical protein